MVIILPDWVGRFADAHPVCRVLTEQAYFVFACLVFFLLTVVLAVAFLGVILPCAICGWAGTCAALGAVRQDDATAARCCCVGLFALMVLVLVAMWAWILPWIVPEFVAEHEILYGVVFGVVVSMGVSSGITATLAEGRPM